ncbi:GNAT family N-acetyltransferase [Pleomorphomonas sp. JP5]|uniref:GNAT family N-acetyltransferase n=1 Tax=Pleomorphomonas sp. JP5 TaxID=2942998 RepID=UPI002044AFCA|nr:GNAT family N-acetyltransferase [Pleomorphomonas sp. JP5]MCM5557848.1 GNAT family N-acetyltransferase [Pleomorphomonas sp. JP5]
MARSGGKWIVEIHDKVDHLEAEWSALVGQHNATPFQSHGFTRLVLRQLATNNQASPIVALVRSRDGRPVALFVMMRSRRHGLRWLLTEARPIDYCAPMFDSSLEEADLPDIVQAVLAAVPGVDLLYCNRMPERFEGGPNPFVRVPNAARLRLSAWKLELAGRSAEEVVTARPASFRANLRRRTQKLAQTHRRAFSLAIGDAIEEADIAAFRELRATSTEEKGRVDILTQEEWSDIYLDLLKGVGGTCRGWLSKLTADGEPIAYLFGILQGRCVVATLPASKMGDWKPYSPGLQLFSDTIEHFRAAGYDCFDLSIGDMDYKRRFGCEEVALYDALFPKTVAGRAYYLLWRLKVAVRARLKPLAEAHATAGKVTKPT